MPAYEIDGVRPVVHPTAWVHPLAVLIGDAVVGPGCYVGPGASMRGDFGRVILDEGANLQDSCVMHSFPGMDAVVERDGHIGHGAILHGCRIGRNALIGMNAVIMDGAVVGEGAIVAAAAFVKAGFIVPARTLAAGMPARLIRPLDDGEIAWKSEGTREYQDLVGRCRRTLREVSPLSAAEPDRPRLAVNPTTPLHVRKGGS